MKHSVEITVPVYNEEKELELNIQKLSDFCEKFLTDYNWKITIADNASSDNTPIIASGIAKKNSRIALFRLEEKGRGRAVKRAWSNSDSDFCVYMDLDLSTDLKHLPNLLKSLQNGYDIAIGSRLAKGANVEGRTFLREITSRTLNFFFIQVWFRTHFTDAQCGFKAVTRRVVDELIPKIKDNDWFFDGELLIVGEKSGYKIYEEPVHWVDNPGSTVRLVSTIWGDIKVMGRLFLTKPWNNNG
ncbi:MAG: Glycosyl transferase family 2 [Microgenomates group bacterium GW2011_GWA2_37_6]|nr:MAG: Glycosyl transferase family 2 [Microgenomates group bacterium GW2011_GWA2_37_6]